MTMTNHELNSHFYFGTLEREMVEQYLKAHDRAGKLYVRQATDLCMNIAEAWKLKNPFHLTTDAVNLLSNDLVAFANHATYELLWSLPSLAKFVYNVVPSNIVTEGMEKAIQDLNHEGNE